MTATMTRNAPLIRKVRDHIKSHAKKHNQANWVQTKDGYHLTNVNEIDLRSLRIDSCGTTACVAGWTVLLDLKTARKNHGDEDIESAAAAMLGLDYEEAHKLFMAQIGTRQMAKVLTRIANGGDVRSVVNAAKRGRP